MKVPVPETKKTPLASCGFREEFCAVSYFPESMPPTVTGPVQREGMHIMSKYPIDDLNRMDSRQSVQKFEETFRKMQDKFGMTSQTMSQNRIVQLISIATRQIVSIYSNYGFL